MAFEYQGEVHYNSIPVYGSFMEKAARDKRKKIVSKGTMSTTFNS